MENEELDNIVVLNDEQGNEVKFEFLDLVELDETGYIVADETGITSDPAIFAAGDIRTKALRQVVTAASDGANAVQSVERYLAQEGR